MLEIIVLYVQGLMSTEIKITVLNFLMDWLS